MHRCVGRTDDWCAKDQVSLDQLMRESFRALVFETCDYVMSRVCMPFERSLAVTPGNNEQKSQTAKHEAWMPLHHLAIQPSLGIQGLGAATFNTIHGQNNLLVRECPLEKDHVRQ